jgi:hypothetical protein
VWREFIAEEWLEAKQRARNATNEPFLASECTSNPVEMIAHVLRETASLFQALRYDNASRNQDAFAMFDL